MKRQTHLFMLLLAMLSIVGCHKEPSSSPTVTLAESVILDDAQLELIEGELYKLSVTILPSNATVQYSSSDESVAYVDRGTIFAIKPGKAVITIASGAIKKECQVSVVIADQSKTFARLPIPEFTLLGDPDKANVFAWEEAHGGTHEPRLSKTDEATGLETIAFNVNDETIRLRIYTISSPSEKKPPVVSEIALYASPIDYAFEIKGSGARLNRALRKLMTREGYILSHITSLGASYVNPTISMGVIISPAKHPEIGGLALFNYKRL